MALYVSAARRLRRTIVIAAVVGVVAFALGWLTGREQVPSIDHRVSQVQAAAGDIATGLERLDIEYEQVLDGTDALDASVLTPLDELRTDLQSTMDRAPWLSVEQRAAVLDLVAQARQAAVDGVSLDAFTADVDDAAAAVRSTFGV